MAQSALRRRMRGSDAMFVYFEKKDMPLHIGAVAILDGPYDQESQDIFAARISELPRYRQRLVFSPLNLTHPAWEDDPDFDIRNHIRRLRLDPPGSEKQLSGLSGEIFTPLMDRTRPLWDITVVEGLEGGRSALICRVHHCMVDGISGIALMNIMFDPTRQPRRVTPEPYNPAPLPDPGQVLVEGLSGWWGDAAERLLSTQLSLLKIVQSFTGSAADQNRRALLAAIPDLLRPTEKLPFNMPCSGVRGHCWTSAPFAEARAIRAAAGGTINDVVLTAVTGAVSRYVLAHREPLKGRFVRMLVPVNVRSEDSRSPGNEISMLPLSIPLDIDDPLERLKVVTLRSSAMKAARIADIVSIIGMGIGWIPPSLQESLAALPFMPQPVRIVNMVCTNVPGPMIPLYANGREVLSYYPHVPCGSEAGLCVSIASYNQSLHYAVTYDMQAAPDGELFRDFLIESYEELRSAAGVAAMSVERRPPAQPPKVSQENLRSFRIPQTPAPIPEIVADIAPPPVAAKPKPTRKRKAVTTKRPKPQADAAVHIN